MALPLKGGYLLSVKEWEACNRLFVEKGMKTLTDWLRYYNNLDVTPVLEALEKMRAFYTERGIDILKDACSIPGVSLHYLLRGSVKLGADIWSPRKEAYDMLKTLSSGGPVSSSREFTVSPERRPTGLPENPWIRRQRAVFVNDAAQHALRPRKGFPF